MLEYHYVMMTYYVYLLESNPLHANHRLAVLPCQVLDIHPFA